ncbi:MAG: thiolase family protein [Oscillospiraceae bacterium]|nr:thiolase family protein [Oscillospiraceae bacterium]
MAERNVVFVDGARTGFGRMGGALRDLPSSELGALAVRGLLKKTGIAERGVVDCLFSGSALNDSQTYSPSRYIALAADLPVSTSTSYVEMQCGSAIDAINHAAWKIKAGCADVIIAGGQESYSQMYAKFSMAVAPYKLIPPSNITQRYSPRREDNISMIEISDAMAERWHIEREACDTFALRSQQRAAEATAKGCFLDEIIPVTLPGGKGKPDTVFAVDEHLRPQTTLEDLAALKPVFGPGHVTTAGNASGRNDGAAFVLMMSEEKAEELGYEPYARWVSCGDYGVEPALMGIGPAYANLIALHRAGLDLNDIDVFECNEAFAAQNLSVIAEMESQTGRIIDQSKWNPNGGAIAFGHPNGASGARVCMFAMKELARRGGRYALFSSCCGGGLGVATLIENLKG